GNEHERGSGCECRSCDRGPELLVQRHYSALQRGDAKGFRLPYSKNCRKSYLGRPSCPYGSYPCAKFTAKRRSPTPPRDLHAYSQTNPHAPVNVRRGASTTRASSCWSRGRL